MQMTIYEVLKQSGVKFSKKDCLNIGNNVSISIKSRKMNLPNKVEQTETHDGATEKFLVYDYPKSYLQLIEKISFRYLKKHYSLVK